MSGYVAVVRFDGGPIERAWIEALAESLRFRGPDGLAIVETNGAAFAHALLAISPEDTHAVQPLRRDGVVVVGDVRIDARADLVRELQAHERRVTADSADAELLLEGHAVWGTDLAAHIIGDYSLAIWDEHERRLTCIRDRFARRPLYYAWMRDALLVTNNLPTLLAHAELAHELDEAALGDFLLFGRNLHAERTTFAKIRRLPAAHRFTATSNGIAVRRYWSIPRRDEPRRIRPRDAYAEFRDVLERAVADRSRTDRIVLSLSGGLDSNAVASTLIRVRGRSGVSAITSVWSGVIEDDEGSFAKHAAEAYEIPHEIHVAAGCEPFEGWDDPRVRGLEPTDEPVSAPFFDFMRGVAQRGRLVLTGEGGDPVLYASHDYFFKLLRRGRLLRMLWDAGSYALTRRRRPPLNLRSQFFRALGRNPRLPDYPAWIDAALERRLDLRARWLEIQVPPPVPPHAYRGDAWRLLDSASWSRTFESMDAGATGYAVDWAAPYFDVRVVEFLFTLPPMPYFANKDLVRESMRGLIPDIVRQRPKVALRRDPSAILFALSRKRYVEAIEAAEELDGLVNRPILRMSLTAAGGSDYQRAQQSFSVGLALWLTKHHS